MRTKNEYLLLVSVIIIVALLIYIMMDQSDRSLAILGGLTAFASVVLTSIINISRIKLDREKAEADLISSVTKETYQAMFKQKIDAYKGLKGLIRDYRNEAASFMYEEEGYDHTQQTYVKIGTNPEEVFTQYLKKTLDFLKENELILSKKLYKYYDLINQTYNDITAEAEAYHHYEACGPDEHEAGRQIWYRSINEKTKAHFDSLTSDLDEEVDKIREKISF